MSLQQIVATDISSSAAIGPTQLSTGAPTWLTNGNINLSGNTINSTSNLTLQTANTNRISITSNGNVGIGTTSPNHPLDILSYSVDAVGLTVRNRTGNDYANFSFTTNDGGTIQTGFVNALTGANGASLIFNKKPDGSAAVEAMRITSTGYVGINTTGPATLLTINGAGTASSNNWMWMGANSLNPPAAATYGLLIGGNLSQSNSETNIVWGQGVSSNQYLGFGKWTGSAYTEQMRMYSNGTLSIGTNLNNGHKFNVYDGSSYFWVSDGTYGTAGFGPRPANDSICSVIFYYNANPDSWKIDATTGAFNIHQTIVGSGDVTPFSLNSAGSLALSGSSTNSTYLSLATSATGGRSWSIYSSGGGPVTAGYFGIYDNNAGANRLYIDTGGTVYAPTALSTGGNFFVGGVASGAGTWLCTFTSNIDVNANRSPGVWGSYASSATNAPDNAGILWNGMSGGQGTGVGDGGQLFQDYSDNKFWTRKRWGGGFGAWTYIGG